MVTTLTTLQTENVTEVLLADGWHRVWWHDTGSTFAVEHTPLWAEEPDVKIARFMENGDAFFGEFTCRFDDIIAIRADHSV